MLIPPTHRALEAGCDEAGRGCLAGPVVAAAVILPRRFRHPLLNDSKQLSESKRNILRQVIEREAIAWQVAMVGPAEIDQTNILVASFDAMHQALNGLGRTPEIILVDGNRFIPYGHIAFRCEVGGDARFMSIAAASILAKTHRDEYMISLSRAHPEYRWEENKGYPTEEHREAIRLHGPTIHHRRTFRLLPEQLSLEFD